MKKSRDTRQRTLSEYYGLRKRPPITDGQKQSDKNTATASDMKRARVTTDAVKEIAPQMRLSVSRDEAMQLLRSFDLNMNFGPCAGLSRRERFERAISLNKSVGQGELIRQILEIAERSNDKELLQPLWHDSL